MPITKKLPSISNVAAGATFTLSCPVGLTYGKITFEMGGTTFDESLISDLTVEINGKPVQIFATGTRLVQLNSYYGRPDDTANGYLTIYFDRPEMNPEFRKLTGLGTQDVDTLVVKGKIDASASAPTLEATATLYPPQPLGAFVKVKQFPISFGAGVNEVDKLPKGPRIIALHAFAGDFTKVEAELDSFKVFEADKTLAESLQKESNRTPQSSAATHVDFCLDGLLSDALVTEGVQDMRFRLTKTAAGAADVVVEYLDGFAGI